MQNITLKIIFIKKKNKKTKIILWNKNQNIQIYI